MGFFRRSKEEEDTTCLICRKREGVTRIEGGYLCGYCIPVTTSFDRPTKDEVLKFHIKDEEIIERIDQFHDTVCMADLHFDDDDRFFFKGYRPNYCIPILSYEEIIGYRIIIDDEPIAFNSISGKRALFKVSTDDYIKKTSKNIDKIMLEVDSGRKNIRFAPYQIRGPQNRVDDTREGCLRFAMEISRRFDKIIEENIIIANQ